MLKKILISLPLFLTVMTSVAQCNVDDYLGLKALFLATKGENWKDKTNWNVSSQNPPANCDLSKFKGISLDPSGRVALINLGQNNLSGQIPKEINKLKNLTTLWLNQNDLTGPIPIEIGDLNKLERLALSYNKLNSNIPFEIYQLINLKELSIEHNNLTGTISEAIRNYSKIERFLINNNSFEGPLPYEFGNLKNLREIFFQNNNFSGCFPASYINLCDKNPNFNYNSNLADWNYYCKNVNCNLENPIQNSSLCNLDKSKMIPLRDAKFRKYQFVISLRGSAINQNSPYEIHYDTGSWTTSIPGKALNLSKIRVLKENITDPWGNYADLVSGQIVIESLDGTPYELNDYIFYATKNKLTGEYLEDDRTAPYANGTNSILGAFPSIDPNTKLPSLPFALASKYQPNNMGLGIISDCYDDIYKNWNSMKSYLQIGNDSKVQEKLNWRNDIPNWRNQQEFHPEAVPGFKVKILFQDTEKIIETENDLIATVDTGAPDLTLRLGQEDPQDKVPFSSHFVKEGPWTLWNNNFYLSSAKTLLNAEVGIEFTDSKGLVNSYRFPVGNDPFATPTTLYSGKWGGQVPYVLRSPDGPPNRINLGNTIYFYCPVYFWDIKNKRVGIGFRNKCQLNSKIKTSSGNMVCEGSSIKVSAEENGINPPFSYKWKSEGKTIGENQELNIFKEGNYILEVTDKEGCISTSSVEILQIKPPSISIERNIVPDVNKGTILQLSVSKEAYQTYQWKKNNQIIPEATSNIFTPNSSGDYTISITYNGCVFTSEPLTVDIVLATDISKRIKVSPIPFENTLTINFNQPLFDNATIKVLSLSGSLQKVFMTSAQNNEIDLSNLQMGLYLLTCEFDNYIEVIKIIKK